MPTSSALPYISFFAISKLMLFFSYFFPVTCIILPNIYFYIVDPWFPFFLIDHNRTLVLLIKWVSCFFSEFKNFFFVLFNFLKMVIFTTLFRGWSTLWNSTLKIATLIQHCLMLLISTSTNKTFFQRWFDIFRRCDVISP